jgi:hypothetical protein
VSLGVGAVAREGSVLLHQLPVVGARSQRSRRDKSNHQDHREDHQACSNRPSLAAGHTAAHQGGPERDRCQQEDEAAPAAVVRLGETVLKADEHQAGQGGDERQHDDQSTAGGCHAGSVRAPVGPRHGPRYSAGLTRSGHPGEPTPGNKRRPALLSVYLRESGIGSGGAER